MAHGNFGVGSCCCNPKCEFGNGYITPPDSFQSGFFGTRATTPETPEWNIAETVVTFPIDGFPGSATSYDIGHWAKCDLAMQPGDVGIRMRFKSSFGVGGFQANLYELVVTNGSDLGTPTYQRTGFILPNNATLKARCVYDPELNTYTKHYIVDDLLVASFLSDFIPPSIDRCEVGAEHSWKARSGFFGPFNPPPDVKCTNIVGRIQQDDP